MRRRFVAKRKKKKFFVYFFIGIVGYVLFEVLIAVSDNVKLISTNEEFLKQLMADSNHYVVYENNKIINKLVNYIINIDLSNPETIIGNSLNHDTSIKALSSISASDDNLVFFSNDNYIKDPNEGVVSNPRVYIYNSHQGENYSQKNYAEYGITPNVMMASYLLEDKLNSLGIGALAEEGNILEFMKANNWEHSSSYVASSYFIKQAMKDNPNLELIIDIHRDAITKKEGTVTINGKNYAKTLFVVGLENKSYKKNLALTQELENLINKHYPKLSRGILKKQGPGVNGVYNQNLSSNVILIEIGGYQNTISEVNNTVDAIAEIIKLYLED